jgi:hypothetical protein
MAGRLLRLVELVLLLAKPLARLACRAAKRLPPGAVVLQLGNRLTALAPGGNSLATLAPGGNRLTALAPGGNSYI